QNPAITPQQWEELLGTGIHDLERLVARYQRNGASFLDNVPKKLLPDLYYLGDFQGVAVYGFCVSDRFVLVNGPGDEGLAEFVKSRLGQLDRNPAALSAILLTSTNSGASTGLGALLAARPCPVISPPAVREAVQRSCPAGTRFVDPKDLKQLEWLSIQ